jgi:carboxypeptidase Q
VNRLLVVAGLCLAGSASADSRIDAQKLSARALSEKGAYTRAVRLADEVGARLAGSPAAARAVEWAVAEMKASGLTNVHTEPVTIDSWLRGADDRVELVGKVNRRLHALAIGLSPPGDATAEVVEVDSFAKLKELGEKVRGKVVFYNKAMQRSKGFDQYGSIGALRFAGALEASKLGAIAAVTRSAGTGYHRLPHTGATEYDAKIAPPIPFAALAAEDADLLHRALQRGPQKIALHLTSGRGPKVTSANVIGEVRGKGKPDEIVLLGAHLDSWDVGDGALDDAAGCGIVLEAARLIADLQPRRTVRVVLFMNEEYELSGAKAYAVAHASELPKHVASIEADAGAGAPLSYSVVGGDASVAIVKKWLDAAGVKEALHAAPRAGSDLGPMVGVPQLAVDQDVSDYFEWHHTEGDTADKIVPDDIERAAAALATVAAMAATRDELLPRLPTPAKR